MELKKPVPEEIDKIVNRDLKIVRDTVSSWQDEFSEELKRAPNMKNISHSSLSQASYHFLKEGCKDIEEEMVKLMEERKKHPVAQKDP